MSAKQFHEFARECMRWAEEATSEDDRRHSSKWPRLGFTRLPSFANLAITLSRCPRHGPHAEKATVPGTFGFGLS